MIYINLLHHVYIPFSNKWLILSMLTANFWLIQMYVKV